MRRFAIALTGVILLTVSLGAAAAWQQDDDQEAKTRRDFMRVKLMFSQNVVEGLSTSDFGMIEDAAQEMLELMENEKWLVVDTPDYKRYTSELTEATNRLKKMSKSNNLEGSALRYFDLTLKCIDCHQYYRRSF